MPNVGDEEHEVGHSDHPPELPPRLEVEFEIGEALGWVAREDRLEPLLDVPALAFLERPRASEKLHAATRHFHNAERWHGAWFRFGGAPMELSSGQYIELRCSSSADCRRKK